MEKAVYIANDNIISSLGIDTQENFTGILNNKTGLKPICHHGFTTFTAAIDWELINNLWNQRAITDYYTQLEKVFILSISKALANTPFNLADQDTVLIVSTTKGNIDHLAAYPDNNSVLPWTLAHKIGEYFKTANTPLVVCNACISGVTAIISGAQLLQSGRYTTAVICGGDIISDFTLSGFSSLKALSSGPCAPYDANRGGLNLGESCGTIILTTHEEAAPDPKVCYWGGAASNDANHISGPSRDGNGLHKAIQRTLQEKNVSPDEIDVISAHGTATVYNDEMESKAFTSAGMSHINLNSLKGIWGHTLGAAGIIESIAAVHSLKNNIILPTYGFKNYGVSGKITVSEKAIPQEITICLKTASGFGGGNAGILFKKWTN